MANDVIKFTLTADDKASSKLSKFNSVLSSGVGVAKNITKAVIGGGVAVTGFTTVVAKHIDKQAKFADRINQSVTELTQYQYAADLAGINTNTFNMAVQRMTRRVGEAAIGTGEAQDALRELNIDARSFQNLGLEDQMGVLADTMGDVANENDKLRLAFKLFDSEGTAMIQMLNQGSTAMQEAANDAIFLGLAIGPQAAAQAELFNDKMTRATGAMKGASNSIAAELMPLMAGLADSFADFVASNRTKIAEFIKGSIEGFVTIGKVLGQVWDGIGKILTDPKALTEFVAKVHEAAVAVGVLALDIAQVLARGVLEGVTIAKDLFIGFGQWIGESLAKLVTGEEVDTIGESLAKIFTDSFARARETVSSGVTDIKDLVISAAPDIGRPLAEAFNIDIDKASEDARKAIENMSIFADATAENIKNTQAVLGEFTRAFQEQYSIFKAEIDNNAVTFMESLRTTASATIDSLSSGLANAIISGNSLLKTMQNVAKQVLTQVTAALIKLGIQRLILSRLMGAAVTGEASAEAGKAVGLAGANMFASMAAAPFPLNLTAPAAAIAAQAGAAAAFSAGAATGSALGAGIGAVAHGGMTNNPAETTALIRKDERILSPRQNQDLTDFLAGGGTAGGANIQNVNITLFPNATNADAVFQMDPEDLADSIGGSIIDALNNLNRRGIRPDYLENDL